MELRTPIRSGRMGIASSLRLASRATSGVAPPSASPVAVAGPAAAAGAAVAVGPAAAAGAVALAGPVAAVATGAAARPAPDAAVGDEALVAVVATVAETAAAPQASPAATAGDGAAAAEPRSYFAPMTPLSSSTWGLAPPQRIHRRSGASATCSPRSPCCSKSWPPLALSLCRRVPGLHGWLARVWIDAPGAVGRSARDSDAAIGVTPHLLDCQATIVEGW
jgi:hypothetical protein